MTIYLGLIVSLVICSWAFYAGKRGISYPIFLTVMLLIALIPVVVAYLI